MKRFSAAPARFAVSGLLALGLSGGMAAGAATSAQAAPVTTASVTSSVSTSFTARQGVMAVNIAKTKKGTPYRWGATGPTAFDCSGFTVWTFARLGKKLPRTADAQYNWSKKISKGQARPGDLVFYGGATKYHVGIYAGNGKMWNAPRTGDVVKLATIRSGASYGRVR